MPAQVLLPSGLFCNCHLHIQNKQFALSILLSCQKLARSLDMQLFSRETTPKKYIHNKVTYLFKKSNTILKKSNNPSSRPSSERQLLLLMTLVVMFITFITSKAQDACTNDTTGNFLLQLAATSGLLLIADVIAVIQIFNLFTPVTHIELFGEDEFQEQ